MEHYNYTNDFRWTSTTVFKDCYDNYSQSMWNADKTNEPVFFNFSKTHDYSSGVCGIGIEHVN